MRTSCYPAKHGMHQAAPRTAIDPLLRPRTGAEAKDSTSAPAYADKCAIGPHDIGISRLPVDLLIFYLSHFAPPASSRSILATNFFCSELRQHGDRHSNIVVTRRASRSVHFTCFFLDCVCAIGSPSFTRQLSHCLDLCIHCQNRLNIPLRFTALAWGASAMTDRQSSAENLHTNPFRRSLLGSWFVMPPLFRWLDLVCCTWPSSRARLSLHIRNRRELGTSQYLANVSSYPSSLRTSSTRRGRAR